MLTICRATQREVAEIAAIVNAAFQIESNFRAGERTSAAEISRLMESSTFLVAREGETVFGAVQVRIKGTSGYFGMLAVDPALQRSGIGRRLLEAAENYCRERECTTMTLSTGSLRQKLLYYYRKFGYQITRVEPAPDDAPFTKPI
ncbi:MAG TPA: GNAT family N-acetyltransferase, partial [Terriglobales bacterium]|nr:GNAT family N-acetyltransferase [Terriglobales bacterium]